MSGIIRLGIVGLDGHGPAFAREVNGPVGKLDGARVVVAMPISSVMVSKEVLEDNVEKTRALGIKIVHKSEELASNADGILILHDDGSQHLALAKRFVSLGKPIFVDKPLEVSTGKARALVELCRENRCAVFTASSLRFSLELRKTLENEEGGRILSAMTYAPYTQKPTMPGWIYYGIHAVEPLYALMGSGCREVHCVSSDSGPVAIGTWEDSRLGIARAISAGEHGYGFTVWKEHTTEVAKVDSSCIYEQLLKKIKAFVETGIPPVDVEESVEVVAFMEAANESMARGGNPVSVVPSGKHRA
jgi:predicted dehydrogenase